MRLLKTRCLDKITMYQAGWSLLGPPLMTVYCYVIGDIMIDTAQPHMQREILQIAAAHRIKRIYLTHHHEDHSGNAAAIKQARNATVYGVPLTARKMSAPDGILPYQKYLWGKTTPLEIQIIPDKIETAAGQMIPVHTPGHSEDHTSFFIKDSGTLFSGDLYLADRIKYFRADEDIKSQIASLKKVLTLDFDRLMCGHHPKFRHGKTHLKQKHDFLEDLHGNIIHLWEKGMTEKQIFHHLKLRENHFIKYFCFGDVSMLNGVRSAVKKHKQSAGSID